MISTIKAKAKKPTSHRIKLTEPNSSPLRKLKPENLIKLIFPKITTALINFIHIGPRVILRSAFQILRTNIFTRLISTLVLVSFDLYYYFRKKISTKQLIINLCLSATLLIGGTLGWHVGTSSVLTIVAENTLLWIVAGVAGAGIISSALDAGCRKIINLFVHTDVDAMLHLINHEFEEMVDEHGLTDEEATSLGKKIHITEKICLKCFCHREKKKYLRTLLKPYFSEFQYIAEE